MPGKRRTRIAEGVYDDKYGRAATVKVRGIQREERFPAGTDLAHIESWRIRTRHELDEERQDTAAAEGPVPERGTFAVDLPRYLKLITGRVSYKSDRSHLSAWLPLIGTVKRNQVKTKHVRDAFAAWHAAELSPRTIRHRRRVLRELYQTLDGAHARPPTKGVKLPAKISSAAPTPVAHAMIKKVAKSLKRGLTSAHRCGPTRTLTTVSHAVPEQAYARFLVRATTGQRPIQIGRAEPADVDLKRKIWFVRPAKGGLAIPLPLDPEMIKAWKTFIAAKAWGEFDSRSFSKTIRRHGWPAGVRPYNLRHTFAIDHLLAGTSLGNLQGLLGHAQIETTRRHYAPVLLALLKKTVGNRKLKLA